MAKQLLLPNWYKPIGWCLLIPASVFGLALAFSDFEIFPIKATVLAIVSQEFLEKTQILAFIKTNVTSTVVGSLFLIGGMLVGFSKEKQEDEFIAKLRLSSLLWAVWVNFILLLLSFLFVYGTAFLTVMMYNMFTVLIIFIVRFNYILRKNSYPFSDEK